MTIATSIRPLVPETFRLFLHAFFAVKVPSLAWPAAPSERRSDLKYHMPFF